MVEDNGFSVLDEFFINWFHQSGTCVPHHVQQALYELFLNVALDKPNDILQYCYHHFANVKACRKITPFSTEKKGMDKDLQNILRTRRRSIYVHTPDPEEDIAFYEEEILHPKPENVKVRLSLSLRNVFLFRHLENRDIMYVVNSMFSMDVKEGDLIIKQGDEGDYFYLIEYGTFTAFTETKGERKNLCVYCGNGSFGELALLYNAARAASVEANTDGRLWAVDRSTFRKIVLKGAFEKRRLYTRVLGRVPILEDLETYDLMNIADAVVETVYTDGKWIFREGDAPDGMYFVVSGAVAVFKRDPDSERDVELKQLTEGAYFGELGLILLRPRAASIRSCGTAKLAFLDSEAFTRLLPPVIVKKMTTKFKLYQEEIQSIFQHSH